MKHNPLPEYLSFMKDGKSAYNWLLTTDNEVIRRDIDNELDSLRENDDYTEEELLARNVDACSEYVEFAKSAFKTPDGVILYRAVCVDSFDDIDWGHVGTYWTVLKASADCYGHPMADTFDAMYVLEAIVKPEDIDWGRGLSLYLIHPHVFEVRVLSHFWVFVTKVTKFVRGEEFPVPFEPMEANVGETPPWE